MHQAAYGGANNNAGNATTNGLSTGNAAGGSSSSVKKDVAAPQYIIKTLKVSMQVADTRKVASAIQHWISTTDPLSTSTGADYSQTGNNAYTVTLSFSVQASLYPNVYSYLRDYSTQSGVKGTLLGFTESVQDVSSDYVDTQSRITNYKGEQARLIQLMNKAQAMSDVVTIEQKLTEVEGSIETSEAHLKSLNSQVTFYTVSVNLQPILDGTPAPRPSVDSGWSIGSIFSSAFAASLGLGQAILTFLIWLLAFSIYIVPVAIIVLLIRKFRTRIVTLLSPAPLLQTPPKTE
ncbi:hypothetical protein KDI_45870 [Dictyobacter arantiisoli]|uniref:DUF4349 domain-containing protein n=2 Tax=Dictyobacter arantiisoli TaxID=2014874 RepID=A0A5A5TJ51_9CHLR|nr:hypothetical protein KDI_45870 [Dictyobacter arantiisoli]